MRGIEKRPWFRPVTSGVSEGVHVLPESAVWKTRDAFSVTNHARQFSFLPFSSAYVAMQVPEAGEPSPFFAGGIVFDCSGVQCAPPSEVVSSSGLPSNGPPTTMPCVASQKAIQSRDPFVVSPVYSINQ